MDATDSNGFIVDFVYYREVSFSFQQNHIPVIRKFVITNFTGCDVSDIIVDLTFEPGFANPVSSNISLIRAGESFQLDNFDLILSPRFLSEVTERVSGFVKITISSKNLVHFQNDFLLDVLAFDQWQGFSTMPELIATFVTPNNPQISGIIHRASQILNEWTGDPSLDEYQSKNPDRVKKQMAALFQSVRELNITYCTPPASFEDTGQRLRLVDTLITQKLGTCLDMTLLYASCLEAMGINPLIIITRGHAFAGGWLIEDTFPDIVNDDFTLLTKRIAEGINEILVVEATHMNTGTTGSFDDAIKKGNYNLVNGDDFVLFVDVAQSRLSGIRPLPQRVKTDHGWEFNDDDKKVTFSDLPDEIFPDKDLTVSGDRDLSKQQIWERRLLDLSLRNNLLNTRITKSTIQLISVSLSKVEDALAAGEEFQLFPKPAEWNNPLRMAGVYQSINQTDPIIDLVKSELSQKRLRTYMSESDLAHGLTNLYRASRLSIEENGANTLYLALGLLKWYETPASQQPRFSPILLLPVEIIRKSACGGYVIRGREEEAIMNITLLEMLRQDFMIGIPGLDPLPRDENGVDVRKVFNIVRQGIMIQSRWDIEEQAILGTFSFTKFIMWNDIHNNAGKLAQNKIVSSLITGRAQWDVDLNQFVPENLDKLYHPSQLILPISADSSQLDAICASGQDKSFILHGPPGTGKSQTITNIIANALYNGKKVLFVAEKMAALSVVQRRLEAIGIAPFCLELHSNKSKKSALIEQLKSTTEIVRRTPPEDFGLEADRIYKVRNELNDYVEALHKKYPFGFSLFEAFSGYSAYSDFKGGINLDGNVIGSLTREKIRIWLELAEELKSAAMMCGSINGHPLRGINTVSYSQQTKAIVAELLAGYSEALISMRSKIAGACKAISIPGPIVKRSQALALADICSLLLSAPDVPSSLLKLTDPVESLNLIIRISRNGIERNRHRDSLLKTFKKDILSLDAGALRAEWNDTLTKWFLPKFLGQQKIAKALKKISRNGKIDKERIVFILDEVLVFRADQDQIDLHTGFMAHVLGLRWQDGEGDWQEIGSVCQTVLKAIDLLMISTGDPARGAESRQLLAATLGEGHKAFLSVYKSALQDYLNNFNNIIDFEKKLNELLSIDFAGIEVHSEDYAENLIIHCENWKRGIDSLRDWVSWNQTRIKVTAEGLGQLVINVENGNIKGSDAVNFFSRNLYRNCAEFIIDRDIRLSAFNGKLFEEKIHKFRRFSKDFVKLSKDELFAKLASRVPNFMQEAAQTSEIGILQRNIRNGARGMTIRRMFDTIPALINRMCPCMLMSPISVAQYIDINNFKFDLIIFDEASQMPTSESVGAIARGKNLIVVGDPKQMPPTNFFSTNNIDEENIEKEDMESILDDCLALSLPSIHLLWHYRSKHESLISFSNSHFYENKLLTFPSPDDLTTKVTFNHIQGFYDRGKSRQNSFEATAVTEEIIRRLSDPELAKKSIGVVTFSSAQQILIDDTLNDAFRLRPDLEMIANGSLEPIFIKNLENVQGDERDIILFSIGYGPDKDKKVNLNFGPINREGGWRRLNVAVSRARYEMQIFSTLKADQIDITRTASEGVAGLKAFLEFAEKGKNSSAMLKVNGIQVNGEFAEHLAGKLREQGFNVLTNIGSSGFKIDIGITNPEAPSEYLLGILCDGYNYKNSKTAGDRDIIQSEVLSLLGWNIHRVWSCDWWDNRDKVLEEIKLAVINSKSPEILRSKAIEPQIVPEKPGGQYPLENSEHKLVLPQKSKYQVLYTASNLPSRSYSPDPDLLSCSRFKSSVGNDILEILEKEAPVSSQVLCRRILESWSVSKLGSRIDKYFNTIFMQMKLKYTDSGKRFYWNADQDPDSYFQYRLATTESQRRDASDISPEEVSNAVREILENMISLSKADLVRESARVFGYNRIGGNVETAMNEGIKKAVSRGFAKVEGDRVCYVE
jgi:hypothetical protein